MSLQNTNRSYLQQLTNKLQVGSYIRIINYHNTPAYNADEFDSQLKFYSQHFCPVSIQDLDDFYNSKRWNKEKPGLILAFYNGYRNNYDVFYPLLEKYGFTGWFFVVTDFINNPVKKQINFARNHTLNIIKDEYPDGRYALSWRELKELSEKHVIGSHTRTHTQITQTSSEELMKEEIVISRRELEDKLNQEIPIFCWLGGEEYGFNKKAAQYVSQAGYHYLLSNFKIEKIK